MKTIKLNVIFSFLTTLIVAYPSGGLTLDNQNVNNSLTKADKANLNPLVKIKEQAISPVYVSNITDKVLYVRFRLNEDSISMCHHQKDSSKQLYPINPKKALFDYSNNILSDCNYDLQVFQDYDGKYLMIQQNYTTDYNGHGDSIESYDKHEKVCNKFFDCTKELIHSYKGVDKLHLIITTSNKVSSPDGNYKYILPQNYQFLDTMVQGGILRAGYLNVLTGVKEYPSLNYYGVCKNKWLSSISTNTNSTVSLRSYINSPQLSLNCDTYTNAVQGFLDQNAYDLGRYCSINNVTLLDGKQNFQTAGVQDIEELRLICGSSKPQEKLINLPSLKNNPSCYDNVRHQTLFAYKSESGVYCKRIPAQPSGKYMEKNNSLVYSSAQWNGYDLSATYAVATDPSHFEQSTTLHYSQLCEFGSKVSLKEGSYTDESGFSHPLLVLACDKYKPSIQSIIKRSNSQWMKQSTVIYDVDYIGNNDLSYPTHATDINQLKLYY
ncbi:MAG: hypothetical protein RLZZ293_845, partial [Pseudomonadota bacterium]